MVTLGWQLWVKFPLSILAGLPSLIWKCHSRQRHPLPFYLYLHPHIIYPYVYILLYISLYSSTSMPLSASPLLPSSLPTYEPLPLSSPLSLTASLSEDPCVSLPAYVSASLSTFTSAGQSLSLALYFLHLHLKILMFIRFISYMFYNYLIIISYLWYTLFISYHLFLMRILLFLICVYCYDNFIKYIPLCCAFDTVLSIITIFLFRGKYLSASI